MNKIDSSQLSVEQKVVFHLANQGYITSVGDVTRALQDQSYADFLITGDGLSDEGIESGECNHKRLSNDEIQEVFDNDED